MRKSKRVRKVVRRQLKENSAWEAQTERIARGNPRSIELVIQSYERNKRRLLG